MNPPTELPKAESLTDRERWARSIALFIFVAAVLITVRSAFQMPGSMVMPGGWSMTMMWMVMPGQTVWDAATMFLVMWQAMMIAMMLPSSWPMLELCQKVAVSAGEKKPALTVIATGTSYFFTWLLFGAGAFAAGMLFSNAAMRSVLFSRAIPASVGVGLIIAGAYQLTPWKNSCLRHCRSPLMFLSEHWRPGIRGAFRVGFTHGAYCVGCCWGLMLIQLLLGVMNLGIMIAVAAAITLEKLWRRGQLLSRFCGMASLAYGFYLIIANAKLP